MEQGEIYLACCIKENIPEELWGVSERGTRKGILMEFRFMLGDSKADVRKQDPVLGGCCPSWGIGIIFL